MDYVLFMRKQIAFMQKKWDFEPYFSQILDSRTGKYQCQTSACAMCSIQFCNDETFSIHLPHFIGENIVVNTNKGER